MKLPPSAAPAKNPIELAKYFRAITSDTIGFVNSRFETYGDIYHTVVRGTGLYVTRDPGHFDEVLRTQARSFSKTQGGFAARRIKQLLGDGLVNAEGEHWRRHRRMINPALSRQRIEGYAPTIASYAAREAATWSAGQSIDITRSMAGLTLQIVTKLLFDHDSGQHVERVHAAMEAFRSSQGLGMVLPAWVPYPPNRRFDAALADVDQIIDSMIEDRRATADRGDDLLSTLLDAVDADGDGQAMSNEELRDELMTLFFAGHETTSNALVWTLWLLSQNPEVEAWVREELDELDGELSAQSLAQLTRTHAAIDEAMRIYPPVAVISRTATEDVQIGGYDVTAGSEVLLWFYFTHRDARWFPDPLRYAPQRFLDEPTWPKPAYMPFGGGQRVCIGKHFALMEATLILAELMRHRQLQFAGEHPPEPMLAVTLAPKDALYMRVVG